MPKFDKNFIFNISEKYILRIVQSEEEIERIAEFNEKIHNEPIADFIKRIYSDHPHKNDIYWIYISEKETNQIISSLALLPLVWKIDDKKIKVAEMGFVGTLESFRGQGLFGILNYYYEKILKKEGYLLTVLRGIPNYYRKYSYEFALPLDGGYALPTSNIPTNPEEDIKIRKASLKDLSLIKKSYITYFKDYCVSTKFDEKSFAFRMMNETCNTTNSMTYVIEQNNKYAGYFTMGSLKDPNQADMILSSQLTKNQMIKVLNFVKKYNPGLVEYFNVNVQEKSDFGNYVNNLGAKLIKPWAWQIKIISLKQFFIALKEVLESRIEQSMFKGLTRELTLSDYRRIITLIFEDGKINEITSIRKHPDQSCDLRIPRPALTKLLLNDRTINEINYIITDALVKKESELLISVLFPKLISLTYSWY